MSTVRLYYCLTGIFSFTRTYIFVTLIGIKKLPTDFKLVISYMWTGMTIEILHINKNQFNHNRQTDDYNNKYKRVGRWISVFKISQNK